jgi:hypothetical protein
MGEVGDNSPAFHREVGARSRKRAASMRCGRSTPAHAAEAFSGARHFDDMASLLAALPQAPVVLYIASSAESSLHGSRRVFSCPLIGSGRRMRNFGQLVADAVTPEFGFFRVFQYLTFRAVMAALYLAADRPRVSA